MAKTIRIIILLGLLLVALSALLLPLALKSQPVRAGLAERLSYHLASEISLESIELAWLPSPHLLVRQTALSQPGLTLRLPEIHLFPRWRSLLELRFEPSRVLLANPELTIDPQLLPTAGTSAPAPPPLLPRSFRGRMQINGGRVVLNDAVSLGGVRLEAAELQAIKGTAQLAPDGLSLDLAIQPSFGQRLTIQATYRADGTYHLEADGHELRLHELIKVPVGGIIAPLEATADLSLNLNGQGLEVFDATLTGGLPCFLVNPLEKRAGKNSSVPADLKQATPITDGAQPDQPEVSSQEVPQVAAAGAAPRVSTREPPRSPQPAASPNRLPVTRLDCGFIKLTLSRRQDNWQLKLDELEVKDPALRLSGTVSRLATAAGPTWEIDLKGRDLDAGAIRRPLVQVLSQFKTAREIADIVLDGRASQAAFYFAGPESDFFIPRTFAAKFELAVDVDWAEIMVPEIELYLPRAWGRLEIKDGVLRLPEARARRGQSQGEGSLSVGFLRDNPVLDLDLRLEAELKDLLEVLPEIIEHPIFRAEIARFPQAEGRAAGHLRVGESWRDFTVEVTVDQAQGELHYDRLPWPITIAGSRGRITRDEVTWQELRGSVGPHQLEQAAGRIAINPQAPFQLTELKAQLATAPFLQHLLEYPLLQQALPPILSRISGPITISRGQADGELFNPAAWQYQAELTFDDLQWYSPLLATEISRSQGRLLLDQNRLEIFQLQARITDTTLHLTGSLSQQKLKHWQGEISISGLFTSAGRDWLRQRDWLPAPILPRPPLLLDALSYQWDDQSSSLAGTLLTQATSPASQLTFKAHRQPQTLAITGQVNQGAQQAQLALEFALPPSPSKDSTKLALGRGPQSPVAAGKPAGGRPFVIDSAGVLGASEAGRMPTENEPLPGFAAPTTVPKPTTLPALRGSPAAPLPNFLTSTGLTLQSASFIGTLNQGTFGQLFDSLAEQLEPGAWQGEIAFAAEDQGAPSLTGQLNINDLRWLPDPAEPTRTLVVNNLEFSGRQQNWQLAKLNLNLSPTEQLILSGPITALPGGLNLGLALHTPYLSQQTLEDWRRIMAPHLPDSPAPEAPGSSRPLTGTVDFNLTRFSGTSRGNAPPLTWTPLNGRLFLPSSGGIMADIHSGIICCLEVKGTWHAGAEEGPGRYRIVPACPQTPRFEELLPCFGISQDIINGDCRLTAELHGEPGDWQRGTVRISSPEGGRILRLQLLARILSLVNLTDLFTGGITGLDERGFAYRSLEFAAEIKNNILTIDKAVIRGEGLNLIARGSLNLSDYQAEMTILVAPFKTLDTVVGWIPLVGRIIGGDAAVIAIPVGLKGDIREPILTVLDPEAVGEGLLNLVRGTLLLPFNIISPILTGPQGP